ncbi:MAG: hypothetical protein JW945_03335 [Methanomicrobia archaeon]|nr:hypothetical protein [Methanomicrobia archaeon]
MGIQTSTEITRLLKERWDRSKQRADWRVLSGCNPKGRHDMFISSPDHLWQLKFEQTGSSEAIGFGLDVGTLDEELKALMSRGSPVPFGLIAPQKADLAIIMAGVQQYSSDTTQKLCKEYISGEQARLDEKLDRELERLQTEPGFRRRYREQKERERIPYV